MVWRIAVAALAALASTAATAGPAKRATVTNPDWETLPSPQALAENYPKIANHLGIEALVIVECKVNPLGRLVGCGVASEEPAGLGFGKAALAMSQWFQMRPQLFDGRPVDGGEVRIPIRFSLPEDRTAAEAPPEPTSPGALREGLRLVDAMDVMASLPKVEEALLSDVKADADAPALATSAAEALRFALAARRDDLRQVYARALASVFSVAEMAAIADFATGPGREIKSDTRFAALQRQIGADFPRAFRVASHDAFCRRDACLTESDAKRIWRAAEPDDERIDSPKWLSEPSAKDISSSKPDVAQLVGLDGAVRASCAALKDGRLDHCVVEEEFPSGLGFGAAALELVDKYRLASGAEGKQVTLRIGFNSPPPSEPVALPTPRTTSAVELARRLGRGDETMETYRRKIEAQLLVIQGHTPDGADPKTFERLIEACRQGVREALDVVQEENVAALAATFSEDQLTALLAFRDSPGWKAQKERGDKAETALLNALKYEMERVTDDARREFCKTRACGIDVAAKPKAHPTAASPESSTR